MTSYFLFLHQILRATVWLLTSSPVRICLLQLLASKHPDREHCIHPRPPPRRRTCRRRCCSTQSLPHGSLHGSGPVSSGPVGWQKGSSHPARKPLHADLRPGTPRPVRGAFTRGPTGTCSALVGHRLQGRLGKEQQTGTRCRPALGAAQGQQVRPAL